MWLLGCSVYKSLMESEGFAWSLCPFVILSSVAQISVVSHQGTAVPGVREDIAFKQFGMGEGRVFMLLPGDFGACGIFLVSEEMGTLPSGMHNRKPNMGLQVG